MIGLYMNSRFNFNICVFKTFMNLKQFNVKHAERWLQKLKNENLQSYKDVTKFLRKYQKTDDEYDCYVKISHTLLAHVELTKQINLFLEDGNKFVVSRPDDEKLKDFMGYVKKNRPQVFTRIISMIQQLSKSKGEGNTQVSKMIIPKLKEIVMGDSELERLTEEALDMTDEELIRRKNVEHLKVNRGLLQIPEEPKDAQPSESQPVRERKTGGNQQKTLDNLVQQKKNQRLQQIGNFTNSSEQRVAIRQFQKNSQQGIYGYVMKVIKLFTLNIITRNQASQFITAAGIEESYLENLKEILETRELDRRKTSVFKPLGDINFSTYERASPSYVTIPTYYPIKCSGKTISIRLVTNDRWISVPYGSEESQNFSVRNKNTNEINLLKAEDQRYEYHLYLKKLTKTKELLDRFLDENSSLDEQGRERQLRRAINLGIVQIIYKNSKQEQKDQLQHFLRTNPFDTCKVFRDKIQNQILELQAIKDIHANKAWNQIAIKNFYKALDLKGFQFKKNEKQKMKNTSFISQLNDRIKIVDNGGESKANSMSFQQKKQFFSIFNSFQSSSRTQKCKNRVFPNFQTFDLKDEKKRPFYPLMILAFQDTKTCQQLYSLLIFYVETAPITEGQKAKCKIFLQQFLIGFLGWKLPIKKTLSEGFNQETFYQKISSIDIEYDFSNCYSLETEVSLIRPSNNSEKMKAQGEAKQQKMYTLSDDQSKYSYLPKKSAQKKVLFCSENVYCLIRYLYTIYERLLKMKQISQNQQSIQLFELLFYACIKAKQGIKFQQNLNLLFGKHAYLFGTIYKLFDSLIKSISMSSSCLLTSNSFKFAQQQDCEDLYLLLVNRYCLANNIANNKIIRITYHTLDKVVYFNSLDCYYKSDQVGKDITRKRSDISRGVEMYTTDYFGSEVRKMRKLNEYYQTNELQHIFEGSTIKMLNHAEHEDLMLQKNRRSNFMKMVKRQLKRVHKLSNLTG